MDQSVPQGVLGTGVGVPLLGTVAAPPAFTPYPLRADCLEEAIPLLNRLDEIASETEDAKKKDRRARERATMLYIPNLPPEVKCTVHGRWLSGCKDNE